jgi:hypothetical protein
MFGRPARDTGFESERITSITAAQRLHLLNSTHVQRNLVQGPKLQALLRARVPPRELVRSFYLAILSRFPTEEEQRLAAAQLASSADKRAAALDLTWALINSAEFLHRH